MIRSKREYRCTNCAWVAIKWSGYCPSCNQADTMQEVMLLPTSAPSRSTDEQRRLRRRSKKSEREIARRMIAADGEDPNFKNIASSTGRVGHITKLQFDTVSRTYVVENKNRKLPTWIIQAWVQINQRGKDYNKNVLLHIEPPNMPKDVPLNGTTFKLGNMAVITQERHEELIKQERILQQITEALNQEDLDEIRRLYWEISKI